MIAMRIYVGHASPGDDALGRELVAALRAGGALLRYEVFDAHAGRKLLANEGQQTDSPASIFLLSADALLSGSMYDVAQSARALTQRDPLRIVLPVLAGPVPDAGIWDFLRGQPRIEAAPGQPWPPGESIWRCLQALALPPTPPPTRPWLFRRGDPPAIHGVRGRALYWQDDLAEAASVLRWAARHERKSPGAWLALATVLDGLHRDRQALDAYQRGLKLDPAHAPAWYAESRVLDRLGRRRQALDVCQRALALAPQYAPYWHNLGCILDNLARLDEALEAYERALRLDGNVAATWADMAITLRKLRRLDEAEAACDRAIELDRGSSRTWTTLGDVFRDERRLDHALSAYEHALELAPGDGLAWHSYGAVLMQVKRYEQAAAAFDRALALSPRLASARRDRATATRALG
jgi:tetratricopeptide (TPR) repeat protein